MRTTITARHFEVSDALNEYILKKTSKLQKFYSDIIDCHVIMSVERRRHLAEITANIYGHTLRGSCKSNDMRTSINRAVEKLERQLKKFHARLREPQRVDKEKILSSLLTEEEEEGEHESQK